MILGPNDLLLGGLAAHAMRLSIVLTERQRQSGS
jgi:hypothetical protein